MQDYEAKIAPHKAALFHQLFASLANKPSIELVEIGIGTAPNLQYYAGKVCGGTNLSACGTRHTPCGSFATGCDCDWSGSQP